MILALGLSHLRVVLGSIPSPALHFFVHFVLNNDTELAAKDGGSVSTEATDRVSKPRRSTMLAICVDADMFVDTEKRYKRLTLLASS